MHKRISEPGVLRLLNKRGKATSVADEDIRCDTLVLLLIGVI
jgi:hypothetical protein